MARIIIIDDETAIADQCSAVLKDAGHEVVTATNGFDGLKLFRANPADLIITDLFMPYGGLPTIRVLREQYPAVRIIAMSGADSSRLDLAGGLGADLTLAKPFLADQLINAVATVLAGSGDAPKP